MTIRFTAKAELPPAEHIDTLEETHRICAYFREAAARGSVIGFDTETSGLDFDGLGVTVHYVCLADEHRRVMIRTSGHGEVNMRPVARMLEDTAHAHAGFNVIYDWNALYGYTRFKLRWEEPLHLKTCYAEGMKLWCLFDEEGQETYGARGLKARARRYIGLPMSSFDRLLEKGGVVEAVETDYLRAVDYATRDAWAHRAIVLLGQKITEDMEWAGQCPHCADAMFVEDRSQKLWQCHAHGWQPAAKTLRMWDWHTKLDVPYMSVLQNLQVRGLPINWGRLEGYIPALTQARDESLRRFHREASDAVVARGGSPVTINPNSAPQLRQWLYGDRDTQGNVIGLNLPVARKTKSGDASTGVKVLKALRVKYDPPGFGALLEFRSQHKILKTYLIGLQKRRFPETGRVHGSFRAVAATGRLTSKDPNMQNLPASPLKVVLPPAVQPPSHDELRLLGFTEEGVSQELASARYQPKTEVVDIRQCIEAPEGQLVVCADYAQLEVRLTALESGCSELTRVVNEGLDLHCYTASIAFADVLAGADYGLIYEAKQASDDDLDPLWENLARGLTSDPEGFLRIRLAKMTDPSKADGIRGAFHAFRGRVLTEAGRRPVIEHLRQTAASDANWAQVDMLLRARHKELLTLRKVAKPAIFGIIYGIGPTGLAIQITDATGIVTSPETAKKLIYAIKEEAYPGVGRMTRRLEQQVRSQGYVRTAMLRYRHPAGIWSGDSGKKAKAVRQAGNFPIQGLAADIVQKAMLAIEADPMLHRLGFLMINQVHDEIVGLAPAEVAHEACHRMVHLMKSTHGLISSVPIDVTGKVATNWGDAK